MKMYIVLLSLVLIPSFTCAMEGEPAQEMQDAPPFTDSEYEMFRDMWQVYAICRKALESGCKDEEIDVNEYASPAQIYWPGVSSDVGQTRQGLFLYLDPRPKFLHTPFGEFGISGSKDYLVSLDKDVESTIVRNIRKRIGIKPSHTHWFDGQVKSVEKMPRDLDENPGCCGGMMRALGLQEEASESEMCIGLWKILSIGEKSLDKPQLRKRSEYLSSDSINGKFKAMILKLKEEKEFKEQINPVLKHSKEDHPIRKCLSRFDFHYPMYQVIHDQESDE